MNRGKRALGTFAPVLAFLIFITWEPFSETDIFVCASGIPDRIKILKLQASQPIIMSKIKNSYQQLWRYGSGVMDAHTRPTNRFPIDDRTSREYKSNYKWNDFFTSTDESMLSHSSMTRNHGMFILHVLQRMPQQTSLNRYCFVKTSIELGSGMLYIIIWLERASFRQ